MISSLDHLNLSIPNFEETVSWYKEVLGFVTVEGGGRTDSRGPSCAPATPCSVSTRPKSSARRAL